MTSELPSDAAIAEALRLSEITHREMSVHEVKHFGTQTSNVRAIIAFARYIEENAK